MARKDGKSRPEAGPDTVNELLGEHRGCMAVVAEVERCLDCQPDREGHWVSRLLESLPRLATTLRAHFEEEQQGPLYRKLPISFPRFAHRLEQLEAEHVRILEVVDGAVARARKLRSAEMYEIRELNAQIQLIVATIRRHEAEEDEILIQAHWDEVGVGD
jgi:hypothetical protein